MRTAILCLLLYSAASAAPYPVVYVAIPRPADDSKPLVQDVELIYQVQPGAHLRIVHPDGTNEVLYQPPAGGGVLDPKVSLDGQWVYFGQRTDCVYGGNQIFEGPTNLYRINVSTRVVEQLTFDTANGVFNQGPCEVPGGRLLYTTNRNRFDTRPRMGVAGDRKKEPAMQMFALQLADPANTVEQVGYLNLRGALHPELMMDGWVMWSSFENHGLRAAKEWALWRWLPDGRTFQPLFSGFTGGISVIHFQSATPDGRIQVVRYYAGKSSAHGAIIDWKPGQGFGSPRGSSNPAMAGFSGGFSFQPVSSNDPFGPEPQTRNLTPWAPANDAGIESCSYPSAAADGLICTVADFNISGGAGRRIIDSGVYKIPYGTDGHCIVTQSREDMELLVNDPAYYEVQPRALASWASIYGGDPPEHAWLPDSREADGTLKNYGYVGTSTVYLRESEHVNGDNILGTKWEQGGDTIAGGTAVINPLISKVRIVAQFPTPQYWDATKWKAGHIERMGVYGEVVPESDGSFLVKVPADRSWTFQLLDAQDRVLTQSLTWHHVRPGEVRTDCRGCHAHNQPGPVFAGSMASAPGYVPLDFTASLKFVEYKRDVKPVLEAKCFPCHDATNAQGGLVINDNLRDDSRVLEFRSIQSPLMSRAIDDHVPVALTDHERWLLPTWIDLDAPLDTGGFFAGLPAEGELPDPGDPDPPPPTKATIKLRETDGTERTFEEVP